MRKIFHWPQDAAEFANCDAGSPRIPVVIDLNYSISLTWAYDVSTQEVCCGYIKPNLGFGGNGGDIEVTWPCEGWPLGRFICGESADPEFRTFIKKQLVQANNDSPGHIAVSNEWLYVGHLDEIISFIPSDNHSVLVASPKLAVDKLHELYAAGHSNETMRVTGTESQPDIQKSIKDILVKTNTSIYFTCQLAETVDSVVTQFVLVTNTFESMSSFPDYLRIDNEYVKTLSAASNTISVERGQWVSNGVGVEATSHSAGAVVYCLSDLVRENINVFGTELRLGPHLRLKENRSSIMNQLSPSTLNFIELPVLFYRPLPSGNKWLAWTANVVNSLIVDGKAIMIEPDGPVVNGTDQFKQLIESQLSGLFTPIFINAWELQNYEGAVHCGSNTRREPIGGTNYWWNAWQGN